MIETERLQIIPLTTVQFQLLLESKILDRNTQEAMEGLYQEVKSVIAETHAGNLPSSRVLEKCGMCQYKQLDKSIFWRLGRE
jgi:hypothetical protein